MAFVSHSCALAFGAAFCSDSVSVSVSLSAFVSYSASAALTFLQLRTAFLRWHATHKRGFGLEDLEFVSEEPQRIACARSFTLAVLAFN